MDDQTILELFRARDEKALEAVTEKYGSYCRTIAQSVLGDPEDAEECVNDMLFDAWRSIPPARPVSLSAFLGKITRRIAIDRLRNRMAAKRGGGEAELTLEEFAEDLRYEGDPALEVEKKALQEAIRRYVNGLAPLDQSLFVLRYWYLEPTARIAQKLNLTETNVHVRLHRLRKRLGRFLEKEGWETI
jgi:RNA polymerase sigma-70 factor (ECF subfamily)